MYRILDKVIKTPNLISNILSKEVGRKSKYVIDYSSPNVAKMFHIGNLRSTLLGDFIKNIYSSAGHTVIGINYLGDWGTQFGILLLPFLENEEIVREFNSYNDMDKMRYITSLYIDYYKKCEENIEMKNKAKEIFKNLETFYSRKKIIDDVNIKHQLDIVNFIRLSSINYLKIFYNKFNVTFDMWSGESDTIEDALNIVKKLIEDKKTEITKDGLTIVRFPNSHNFATIAKSDGSSLYLSRDVAAILKRDELYQADNYIYVVDHSQTSHFENLKLVLDKLGRKDLSDKILHISFGRVKGLSTRHGKTKFVDDIVSKGIELSEDYIKNSPTSKVNNSNEIKEISEKLAISTIKINEYQRKKSSEYEFSFIDAFKVKKKNCLMFQEKYSRLCSLIENNKEYLNILNDASFKFNLNLMSEYKNDVEKLIHQIGKLDQILLQAHNTLEPSVVVVYLSELCTILGPVIQNVRISQQGNDIGASRLLLFLTSKYIIESLLTLLGITPIKKM